MFDRHKLPMVLLVVFALLTGYFYTQVDWEERAIRRQLSELTVLVEKDGPTSTFDSVGRSRKLVSYFAENPSIEFIPERRLPKDLNSISGAFLSIWGEIDRASVLIRRHEVEIDEDRAESSVTAKCSVFINGSDRVGELVDYRISWIRFDGEWLIKSVVALGSS